MPTGAIKIGFSDDVPNRLGRLAWEYGCELDLLHTMPGDRSVESELHEMFSHLRFGRTEQFQPAPELMAFMGRPALATENPEDVEVVETKGCCIHFSLSEKTLGKIESIRAAQEIAASQAAIVRHLIGKGIEFIEKEAANG
jgi:hypothetical protein